MNINTTLLFYLGMAFLASNGFARNLQNTDLQKHYPGNQEITEKNTLKKIDRRTQSNNEPVKPAQRLVYIPPFLGAPSANRLVGMAVRGSAREDLFLSVLSPEHTGLTSQAQPVLYWYISRPLSKYFQFIEFVLNSETATTPVLRTHLNPPPKKGIQKISLADYNISLTPGVEYTWSIALVADATSRSLDLVSASKIKFVESDQALQISLKESSTDQYPYLFAQAGLWYEAMANIVNLVEKQPENPIHKKALATLLKQVGLDKITVN